MNNRRARVTLIRRPDQAAPANAASINRLLSAVACGKKRLNAEVFSIMLDWL